MAEILLSVAALIFALAVLAGEIHFALETRRFYRPRTPALPNDAEDLAPRGEGSDG